MKKMIICTVCPNGCEMEANYTNEQELQVSGNRCKRGIDYCRNECFDPKRTFTASVRIQGAERAMLPVRSSSPIPKDMLLQCAAEMQNITLEAPVTCHDVILKNMLGTDADLVAAMTLNREE